MIKLAVLKLTCWYLAIITALSLGFSFFLYHLYDVEVTRGIHRQDTFFNQTLPQGLPNFNEFRQAQLLEGHRHLVGNLILFNLVVLVAGGAASYALARRTLRPIAEAFEAQSRFTADASHELRTPLTAMQTEIEVALRDGHLTQADAEAILHSNLEEIGKLKALSDGLLRLARNEGSQDTWQKLRLKSIAKAALKSISGLADKQSTHVLNQIGDFQVRGDQTSLVELLVILLDNAIKYSPPQATVKLTTRKVGSFVSLAVIDHGQGIKASDLPHIFDRFYRADLSRSKDKANGYGLGLSIAKKIVDIHGGKIEAKSAIGKGSTFIVKLPLYS